MGSEKGAMCMLFQCGWAPVCGLLEDLFGQVLVMAWGSEFNRGKSCVIVARWFLSLSLNVTLPASGLDPVGRLSMVVVSLRCPW